MFDGPPSDDIGKHAVIDVLPARSSFGKRDFRLEVQRPRSGS